MKWQKTKAEKKLNLLIEQIPNLAEGRRFSAEHTRWMIEVRQFLQEVFGNNSDFYRTFCQLRFQETGSFVYGGPGDPEGSWNPQYAIERQHQTVFGQHLEIAKGVLQAALDKLKRNDIESVYQGKDTGPESSAIIRIFNIADKKLRKVIRQVPKLEKEVQDAFENLLIGADISYAREFPVIDYSSKTYKPDFSVEKIDLAIEIKLCT